MLCRGGGGGGAEGKGGGEKGGEGSHEMHTHKADLILQLHIFI